MNLSNVARSFPLHSPSNFLLSASLVFFSTNFLLLPCKLQTPNPLPAPTIMQPTSAWNRI
jgi:hypothetical protein